MMYRLLLFFIVITYSASAQKTINPDAFAKTITAQDLKKHLTIIAGAEMEGRNTPSPGLEKAADYITQQFKMFGLKAGNNGSFRQTYSLFKDSATEQFLNINGKDYTAYSDFAPYIFQNDNVNMHFNEYAFVGYGIVDETRNDYNNIDVKDKLVVLVSGTPKNYTSSKQGRLSPAFISNKIKIAKEKGAKAIFVVSDVLPSRMGGRTAYRPQMSQGRNNDFSTPIFFINGNVVSDVGGQTLQTVIAALDNGSAPLGMEKADVVLKYKANKSQAYASNIIGLVEGSDKKDEYVIITAHYDHLGKDANGNIYNGADDDGSGTVGVIEIAEAFAKAKKAGKGPRRTLIFMTVSGEEKGLWGSEYYATNPVYPLSKTSVNLNIDMIGRTGYDYQNDKDAENYVYVIGDDKLSSDLATVTDLVNKKYAKIKLDRKYNDPNDPERFYYRSDHYNFAKNGVPAIFYFNGVHADYHKSTDTVDKINFNLLAKRARLVFYTAWEMANRNDMVKRDLKLPIGSR